MTTLDYTPFSEPIVTPTATMQSVNNSTYMAAGSTYSSTTYAPGASTPYSAPRRSKAGFGDITTGENSNYKPNNPQFAPLGDAVLPMLLISMLFTCIIYLRRRKLKTT